MTPPCRPAAPRGLFFVVLALLASIVVVWPGALRAAEKPRWSEGLEAVIDADMPTLDAQQEGSRKDLDTAIEEIDAPDPATVILRLKFQPASLTTNFASPWNTIDPKKYLDKDPDYFITHVAGSGPFRLERSTRAVTFEGERNPDAAIEDPACLNFSTFVISAATSTAKFLEAVLKD